MPAAPPIVWHLDGSPRLMRSGERVRTGSRNAIALALWLQLEGATRRDRVAAVFWPRVEPAAQRRNLRRDVFRLRQAGLEVREDAGEALAMTPLDVAWPEPGERPPDWLAGLDARGGAEFDEWLMLQRERVHGRWLEHLAQRARAIEATGNEGEALAAWRRLLGEGAGGPDHAEAARESRRLARLLGMPAAAEDPAAGPAMGPAPALSTLPMQSVAPRAWPDVTALPLVGREPDLAALLDALRRGRRVYVEGTAGVGKTRLVLEAAAQLGGALLATCRPEDAAVPYASAARVLQTFGADEAAALPAWVRHELAAWVPGWPAEPFDLDGPRGSADAALRRMAFAYRHALCTLARGAFGAWVIDDAQWADASSLALWNGMQAAADGAEGADDRNPPLPPLPPLVVVHRSAELAPAALDERRRLVDAGLACVVSLEPLDGAGALALVRRLTHTPAGERFAARLHEATGGNPMFLLHTLRHLADQGLLAGNAEGRWSTPFDSVTADYAELPLPATVREMVLARVRALGAPVRRLLEAASLAGDRFSAALLAPPAGLTPLQAAQALDHALAAGLVVAADEAGGYRFGHDLIAQSVADALSAARRAALNGELAAQLEAAGAAPGRIARHLAAAGLAARAAVWHHRAGLAARHAGAPAEALAELDVALALSHDPELRVSCRVHRARLLHELSRPDEVQPTLDAALADAAQVGPARCLDVLIARLDDMAERDSDPARALELAGRIRRDAALGGEQAARLAHAEGNLLLRHGRVDEALALLQRGLDELPGSALERRLALVGALGRALRFAGRLTQAREAAQEHVDLAQALGPPDREAIARMQLASLLSETGDEDAGAAMLGRALALARASGSIAALRAGLVIRAGTAMNAGRIEEALAAIVEAENAAPYWDNPAVRQFCREGHFYADHLLGHLDALRAQAEPLLAAARATGAPFQRLSALRLVCSARLVDPACGDPLDAPCRGVEPLLQEARDVLRDSPNFNGFGVAMAAREVEWLRRGGHPRRAIELAARWLESGEGAMVDARAELVAAAAEAAIEAGDTAQAQHWLDRAPAAGSVGLDSQVRLAIARLRCAAAVGDAAALATARDVATQWLSDPRLPRLEGALLARRLAQLAPAG